MGIMRAARGDAERSPLKQPWEYADPPQCGRIQVRRNSSTETAYSGLYQASEPRPAKASQARRDTKGGLQRM